jgi:hypothetical protein
MRIYIIYLLTSVLNFFLIMLYWGASAGFANYTPIVSLFGSLILFTVATPIIVYNTRIGLMLGGIGCLLILVYELPVILINIQKVIIEHRFQWEALLISIPSLLALMSTYITAKAFLSKSSFWVGMPRNRVVKALLVSIPVSLFVLYLLIYGKYWSKDMFII